MFAVCKATASRLCMQRDGGRKASFNQEIHSTLLTPPSSLPFSPPSPSTADLCENRGAKLPRSSQTKTSCWLLNCFACMLIGQKSLQCIRVARGILECTSVCVCVFACVCVCVSEFDMCLLHECVLLYSNCIPVLMCACQCALCVCVCVSVCVCNNLQRFVGYLFLLVNCEADSIAGPGQTKWALSQITSVIACVLVPRRPHQDGAGKGPCSAARACI